LEQTGIWPRKAQYFLSSLFSFEINFTNSSDEDEQHEYLFFSSRPFSSIRTKLEKSSQPTTESVMSLTVNNEENLLKALADTYTSSIIIFEAYTSAPFIKKDESNTSIWSTMGV
jgi:hypothetical protein